MITLNIHTQSKQEADHLLTSLFENHLIALATITKGNDIIKIENDKTVKHDQYIITAQTKALLFNKIQDFIVEHFGKNITLYSTPIIQCSETLEDLIKHHTQHIL